MGVDHHPHRPLPNRIAAFLLQQSLLTGREVTASVPHTVCGICIGVSETGDLLLEAGGKRIPVTFGEVTGRLQFEGMPGEE